MQPIHVSRGSGWHCTNWRGKVLRAFTDRDVMSAQESLTFPLLYTNLVNGNCDGGNRLSSREVSLQLIVIIRVGICIDMSQSIGWDHA